MNPEFNQGTLNQRIRHVLNQEELLQPQIESMTLFRQTLMSAMTHTVETDVWAKWTRYIQGGGDIKDYQVKIRDILSSLENKSNSLMEIRPIVKISELEEYQDIPTSTTGFINLISCLFTSNVSQSIVQNRPNLSLIPRRIQGV
jgi:hypothetical protein